MLPFYSSSLFLDQFTPVSIYYCVKKIFKDKITFLFESSISDKSSGSFSYIAIGAKERLWHKDNRSFYQNENGIIKEVDTNPLLFLKQYYKSVDKDFYKKKAKELGVGLIDGFIGNIGFDMAKEFEPVLKPYMKDLQDDLKTADLDMIRPQLILAFCHKTSKLIMMTTSQDMSSYFTILKDELNKGIKPIPIAKATILDDGKFSFSKEQFFQMVAKSKEMIKEGDVFQILMSNRFIQKAKVDHISFYRTLRAKNPSPYLFLLQYEDFSIVGSSPEVMIRLNDGDILLRPIAGTRKRGGTTQRDIELEYELMNDPKERAEHIMLIDLGRNDVSRVAKKGSVKVTNMMRVERYSHVMHIVSDVEAKLDEKYDMFDLFMAVFTAGTMSGAPKIRAMELISQIEGIKRNFYSGSICYFGFDGNMDSAITIRTALIKDDSIIFQAGAGIVADSLPELEYLEVYNKLASNIASLKELSS